MVSLGTVLLDTEIRREGAKALAEALEANRTVTELTLSGVRPSCIRISAMMA